MGARRRPGWQSWPVLALLALIACSASRGPGDAGSSGRTPPAPREPVDLALDWVPAPPETVGVDRAALDRAFSGATGVAGLESAVIVRRGRLVGEWYRDAGSVGAVRSVRSVTKSVLSLLVGVAIDRRILQGTDEPLASTFHPPLPAITGPATAITLDHLLTMSAGFRWDESGVTEFNDWLLAPDQVAYVLARPIVTAPGTHWNYDSAAVHLLSAALTSSYDAGTAGFADEVLFRPLGIQERVWGLDHQGIPNGGAGLSLTTRDLAKVGVLMLQGGRSGGSQLIPEAWILGATTPRFPGVGWLDATGALDYGRLWWLGQVHGARLLLAWGYGGQLVAVMPELDLVVVTTALFQNLADAPAQTNGIMSWITGSVLLAMQ